MPNYRRAYTKGGTYFFTVTTYRRRPVLTQPRMREALRRAVLEVRRSWPFSIDAWVLLPDHLHCVWTLPPNDSDFSGRWAAIKRRVTRAYVEAVGQDVVESASRIARREGSLRQRRFWEHRIRDEEDLRRHVDYVYWNPVKHGYVDRVADWPHSTFHRDVARRIYPPDWGGGDTVSDGPFGE